MSKQNPEPAGFKDAYVIPTDRNHYRSGEPARVIGIQSVRPTSTDPWRPAIQVEYADGAKDWIAISDFGALEFIDEDAIRRGYTRRGA